MKATILNNPYTNVLAITQASQWVTGNYDYYQPPQYKSLMPDVTHWICAYCRSVVETVSRCQSCGAPKLSPKGEL